MVDFQPFASVEAQYHVLGLYTPEITGLVQALAGWTRGGGRCCSCRSSPGSRAS